MSNECEHLQEAQPDSRPPVTPSSQGCQECLRTGDEWVHLRLCLACGHVGCCNDSPNRHATAHHKKEGHPVIRSFEPGEDWAYCYVDDEMALMPSYPEEAAPVHYFPPERASP